MMSIWLLHSDKSFHDDVKTNMNQILNIERFRHAHVEYKNKNDYFQPEVQNTESFTSEGIKY
jgi:hypothetical protein